MFMPNAIIIHGYGADPSSNWFPWLASELREEGWQVKVPDFGQDMVPSYEEWKKKFLEEVKGLLPSETVLIGHSLGGALIPRVLSEWNSEVFRASFLVAAPVENIGWGNLQPFFDASRLGDAAKMGKVKLFYSDDDPYVSLEHGEKYRDLLGGELTVEKGKEHLWQSTYEDLKESILEIV